MFFLLSGMNATEVAISSGFQQKNGLRTLGVKICKIRQNSVTFFLKTMDFDVFYGNLHYTRIIRWLGEKQIGSRFTTTTSHILNPNPNGHL